MKLTLVIDKSSAFLDYMLRSIADLWYEGAALRRINSTSEAGAMSLFGDDPIQWMKVDSKNAVQDLLSCFESLGEDADSRNKAFDRKFPNGLILLCDIDRRSTRKLEKKIEQLGGTLTIPDPKNKRKVTEDLLSGFKLRNYVRDFVVDYVGDDYDLALPMVRFLKTFTDDELRALDLEDIQDELPIAPGSLPPWEPVNALLKGNLNEALEKARRVGNRNSTVYLTTFAVLRNKVHLISRVATFNDIEVSDKVVSELLKVKNNYSLVVARRSARRIGYNDCHRLLTLVTGYEQKFKGGSMVSDSVLMDELLVEAHGIITGKW